MMLNFADGVPGSFFLRDSDGGGTGGGTGAANDKTGGLSGGLNVSSDMFSGDTFTGSATKGPSDQTGFGPSVAGTRGDAAGGKSVETVSAGRNTGGGLGSDMGQGFASFFDSTPMAEQRDTMSSFSPAEAATRDFATLSSPSMISGRTDTIGAGGFNPGNDARSVGTYDAYASPDGPGAQATARAQTFSNLSEYGALLGVIRNAEARRTDPYNSLVFGAGTPTHADLTNMTLDDVFAYQAGMRKAGHASTAVGAYQTIEGTLKAAVNQLGLDPKTTKFTPEIQDTIAATLIDNRGFKGYKSGKKSADSFANSLAKEWAGLPTDQGKSYYAGVGKNGSTVSRGTVMNALSNPTGPNTSSFAPQANNEVEMYATGSQVADVDRPGSALGNTQVASVAQEEAPAAARDFAPEATAPTIETVSVKVNPEDPAPASTPVQTAKATTPTERLATTYFTSQPPDDGTRNTNTRSVQTIAIGPDNSLTNDPGVQAIDAAVTDPVAAPEKTSSPVKTAVSTGIDIAAGAIPGIGLINGIGAVTGLGSLGQLLTDQVDFSNNDPYTGPNRNPETESIERSPPDIIEKVEPEKTAEPVKRLTSIYLSPYPTPAERWGPDARTYRGA